MSTVNFQMFSLDLEKADESEKLPTSIGSLKKQESSRNTSTFILSYVKYSCIYVLFVAKCIELYLRNFEFIPSYGMKH